MIWSHESTRRNTVDSPQTPERRRVLVLCWQSSNYIFIVTTNSSSMAAEPHRIHKKAKKFNTEWLLKYGLEVATREPSTGDVTSVMCLFCCRFGRGNEVDSIIGEERKRKRTTNTKYFCYPWRADNFACHLKQQHPAKWGEYSQMSWERKEQYFEKNECAEVVNMRSFIQSGGSMKARIMANEKCTFTIDAPIIKTLVFGLLFDDDDENEEGGGHDSHEKRKEYAFKKLVQHDENNTCSIAIKSVLKLNMVAKFVAVGVSFRQASKLYQAVREESGMGVMGSISDLDVAQICRTVCAINLQYLKEIFKNIWAFSIAIDAGNNASTSYLDLRMRCYFQNTVQNLHILAIPMRDRHTGQYQYDLVVKTLDVLAPDWRHQLIGITTDGASTMTGSIQGTVTRLSTECRGSIFRVWCGAHQLDLVVKKAFSQLLGEKFLSTLTGVTGHLRRQQNLIQEMKTTCPTFATTRWISMGKVLKWFAANRTRLLAHFTEKKPQCTPPTEWWLVVIIIQGLVERIEKTFVSMQGMRTLVCEQRQLLADLKRDIAERYSIKGPTTVERLNAFLSTSINASNIFHLSNYYTTKDEVAKAIDEVGGFVLQTMDNLKTSDSVEDMEAYNNVTSMIGNFSLQLVVGISKVCAERNNQNHAAVDDQVPPVLPLDLCKMPSRDFVLCLEKQRIRLRHKFLNDDELEKIDEQFFKLRLAFREQTGFVERLENTQASASPVQSFEICWGTLGSDFENLQNFCGALASVMPSTSTVESDFSQINWTKDPNSQNLSDFSLESILHCKQHKQLRELFE